MNMHLRRRPLVHFFPRAIHSSIFPCSALFTSLALSSRFHKPHKIIRSTLFLSRTLLDCHYGEIAWEKSSKYYDNSSIAQGGIHSFIGCTCQNLGRCNFEIEIPARPTRRREPLPAIEGDRRDGGRWEVLALFFSSGTIKANQESGFRKWKVCLVYPYLPIRRHRRGMRKCLAAICSIWPPVFGGSSAGL